MFNWFKKKSVDPSPESQKTREALAPTRTGFLSKLGILLSGKSKIDSDLLDELEEALLTSDVGVDTTMAIVDAVKARAKNQGFDAPDDINAWLAEITDTLMPNIGDH
jgi:fused signal recognition particle receptor